MKRRGRKQFIPTQFQQISLRPSGASLADHFVAYRADAELVNARILEALPGQNAIQPTGDTGGFVIRRFSAAQVAQIFQIQDENGIAHFLDVNANGALQIGKGIQSDGGGVKHQRTNIPSVLSGGGSQIVTVTWATAFTDTNYTIVASAYGGAALLNVESYVKAAGSVQFVIRNNSAINTSGTLEVIAVHD